MKTSRGLLGWVGAAVLAGVLPLAAEPSLDWMGRSAPAFAGQDQDGNAWRSTDHIGKQVLFLYFYPKDDTTGCTAEACSMRDNMAELKQAGVDVVGVSFDDQDSHKSFIFKYNLDFPLLADTNGAVADAFGVRRGEYMKTDAPTFSADEIKDWPGLVNRLKEHADPVSTFLWTLFTKPEQSLLSNYQPSAPGAQAAQESVLRVFSKLLGEASLYKVKRFQGVSLRPETTGLMKKKSAPAGPALIRFNRLLLEDVFPVELTRNQSMDRRVSFLIGLDGKIIHVTDSPDPAVHVKELAGAVAKLRGNVSP